MLDFITNIFDDILTANYAVVPVGTYILEPQSVLTCLKTLSVYKKYSLTLILLANILYTH